MSCEYMATFDDQHSSTWAFFSYYLVFCFDNCFRGRFQCWCDSKVIPFVTWRSGLLCSLCSYTPPCGRVNLSVWMQFHNVGRWISELLNCVKIKLHDWELGLANDSGRVRACAFFSPSPLTPFLACQTASNFAFPAGGRQYMKFKAVK